MEGAKKRGAQTHRLTKERQVFRLLYTVSEQETYGCVVILAVIRN